jgi:hypothetical protein
MTISKENNDNDNNNYYYKYLKYKKKYLKLKENQPARYGIFAGFLYYPDGGYSDFYDATNSLDDANKIYDGIINKKIKCKPVHNYYEDDPCYYDWVQVVDRVSNEIILSKQID